MKNTLLLPHRFKAIGWLLLIPALAASLAVTVFGWEWSLLDVNLPRWMPGVDGGLFGPAKNNLTNELALTLTAAALLILCFSAEKEEDEFIRHTRLQSLQWALFFHLVILAVATWLVYNSEFWYVPLAGMLAIPVIFLIRFHWMLYRNQRNLEEAA